MRTVTVPNIPLETDTPAERLRSTSAATRVSLHWWENYPALNPQQKEAVSLSYTADPRFLRAGKKLLDTRHEAMRRLTAIKTRIVKYWRGRTLPYVEDGIRLLLQSDIESFVHDMEGFRGELTQAEAYPRLAYPDLKAAARRRLGGLYHEGE